jgi:two-component system OmpR family response regulator
MHVLIVEDDRKIASFTSRGLREEGFVVDVVEDGETGLAAALTRTHDLILLDIRMPGRDGVEVVKEMRRAGLKTPVILLTAAISVPDKVRGLDAGADDYLTKPFAFDELMARIRAVLRRQAGPEAGDARLVFGGIEADLHTQTVTREGRQLDLTAREYAVLVYFLRHPRRVVTRTMLLEHVWDQHSDTETNVIEALIYRLREKVDRGFERPLLHTLRGRGYILQDSADA